MGELLDKVTTQSQFRARTLEAVIDRFRARFSELQSSIADFPIDFSTFSLILSHSFFQRARLL